MPKRPAATDICNLVVVSDLHVGCQLGLMASGGAILDEGGPVLPSVFQRKVWAWWCEFWDEFVPKVTKDEPFGVVINGDALDGVHHNSTTQWSHNLNDQRRHALAILQPLVALAEGRFWMVRGTEAHVGKSAADEEQLARELGARPNSIGQHARNELWKRVGPRTVHLLHHIGATGSQAYESTAVHKELIESYIEAARWGRTPPDGIVRSHRHRAIKDSIPTVNGEAFAVVTPGWQGKTPFAWKIPGARLSEPQFGGIVVRYDRDELFVRQFTKTLAREHPE